MDDHDDRSFAEVTERLERWQESERAEWLARMAQLTALIDDLCDKQAHGLPHERLHARGMLQSLEVGIQFKIDCLTKAI